VRNPAYFCLQDRFITGAPLFVRAALPFISALAAQSAR
jgi:hypothetical protein